MGPPDSRSDEPPERGPALVTSVALLLFSLLQLLLPTTRFLPGGCGRARAQDVCAPTLESLQEVLRPGELLYVLEGESEPPRICALSRADVREAELALGRGALRARAELFLALMRDPGHPAEAAVRCAVEDSAALRLGDLLLAPIADLLRENRLLTIAVEGPLRELPWGTLRFRPEAAPQAEPRMLLDCVSALSITRTADLLGSRSAPAQAIGAVGAVGYEAPPRVLLEQRSPIAGAYRGVDVRPARADLQRLMRARGYDLMQLAPTEQLRRELPYLRFGMLGKTPRLVVLASEPGVAAVQAAGAAQGLIDAGVPTVLTALWPVDPWVEQRFLTGFYAALSEGRTAAEALTVTQRALRDDAATRSPAFWGGFVVFGESESVVVLRPREASVWLRALLASLALTGVALYASWRRRNPLP